MTHENISRYSGFAQLLHWLTALLVVVAFILGLPGSEEQVYAAASDVQRHFHETLGISILLLTVLRLAWRWWDTQPAEPALAPWMAITAKLVQLALVGLLFLVPLSAISGAWLEGHPLTLLFGVQVAPLFGPSHGLGDTMVDVHRALADILIWLAGLHALAAIYHHVVRGDEVLLMMLPRKIGNWIPRKDK